MSTIIYCPICGKVRKHGKWVYLTGHEMEKLKYEEKNIEFEQEICPTCKEKEEQECH